MEKDWIEYDFFDLSKRPTESGRYLVFRAKCRKIEFQQWNGSGFGYNNNDITHFQTPVAPTGFKWECTN